MLRTVDLTGITSDYRSQLPRAEFDVEAALEVVRPICADVHARGVEALAEYSERFDGVVPESFRVPADVLRRCAEELDPQLAEAFTESIRRRRHVAQTLELDADPPPAVLAEGARVGLRNIPVDRVGLYVPGGLAPLASSVIMNTVPAQVAGVRQIAVASPPQKDFGGWPHPNILALCHMLGVDEVYAVGGAQAVAMFAHGVRDLCEPVSLVTGPGNIWVVAAKRQLRGVVGIDSEAGPTEIAIIADGSANPVYVAADIISQAEHDPLAASVLITDSPALAVKVGAEVEKQLAATKHVERIRTSLTGRQSAIVLVRDLDQAIAVADAYGAEHLEIQTADAAAVAARIRNAGAIFVGDNSPVSLGDYSAGSTHVLPTAGCACHSSGLNVRSFMRTVHVIDYTRDALLEIADGVERFALAEDLPGHANAITVRRQQ
ncbi:histidinol dehydrogenase [Tessaracoccus antarcticus]|uniref:Histidinol dehydrogenase n=1 Tax=Tessaracoccus antarcticus TaxID=2479848 RepID=A0A3M0GB20_9ACTN|nr:histidinol dehydrogenase [Tessaracoccus antarcticus]RMB58773.1 histidinol dehydrogenase [Tessaracoccus antarcticus]